MAIALVGSQINGTKSTGRVASFGVTLPSNPSNGNAIVVGAVLYDNGPFGASSSISDGTNTYTQAVKHVRATNYDAVEVSHSTNITGGALTITCTAPGSTTYIGLSVAEFSGVVTASPVEATSTGQANSNAPSTGNIVTTDTDLIFGVMTCSGSSVTITVGSSFNLVYEQESSSYTMLSGEYRIPASGTYVADWSLSAARNWTCCAAALKPAAGGGGSLSIPVAMAQYRQRWN